MNNPKLLSVKAKSSPNHADVTPPNQMQVSQTQLGQTQPSQTQWNYEAAVKEIEARIAQIESGDLDLAEVFDQFSMAVDNLHQCETFLTERQQQMELLIETLSDESEF